MTTVSISESPFLPTCLAFTASPSTLLIREAESLSSELLPQGSVLLLKIFDHVLLVSIDPASEDQHQELQR